MNTHNCIKCGAQYEDSEVDNYYCATCLVEKKRIAAEVDAKLAGRPRKQVVSRFSAKDFKGKNGRIFFNANDIL
jgi:predicted  nucleic acid-binding Zn-ribbon protein